MYCWSRINNIIYCILVLYSLHTSLPEVNEFLFIHPNPNVCTCLYKKYSYSHLKFLISLMNF